ncbi:MAG TPA: nuclear transport factor 2 family protein [Acidimicrobiales bacterium]|nr:nuclear transport factor 2 family protein [Acidimicrobiales bacterium]
MPTRDQVTQLARLVEQNRVLDAIDQFYDENVSMQDNLNPPVVGKAANRERERQFFGGITVHGNHPLSITVDGDDAVIHWLFEFTGGDGKRYRMDQLSHQHWKDGRVVKERFYYDSASLVVDGAAVAAA